MEHLACYRVMSSFLLTRTVIFLTVIAKGQSLRPTTATNIFFHNIYSRFENLKINMIGVIQNVLFFQKLSFFVGFLTASYLTDKVTVTIGEGKIWQISSEAFWRKVLTV